MRCNFTKNLKPYIMNLVDKLKKEHKGKVRPTILEELKKYRFYTEVSVFIACEAYWDVYPTRVFDLRSYAELFENENNR